MLVLDDTNETIQYCDGETMSYNEMKEFENRLFMVLGWRKNLSRELYLLDRICKEIKEKERELKKAGE